MWGLNNFDKRKIIKASFRRWNPHVVCLQETKIGIIDRGVINSIGGNNWFDWDFLGSVGAAGGILIMWDRRVVVKKDVPIGEWSVSCLLRMVENNKPWVFSGVYGPCANDRRQGLWDELRLVRSRWNVPWCIGGMSFVIRRSVRALRGIPLLL